MKDHFDIIVVGAGHAGIEASVSCCRMGLKTLLICLKRETIGLMSCNPAIGGVGKGQLVKEVDALGGLMAKAADACAIGYRTLNLSKGPAVWSTRCQIDRKVYNQFMIDFLSNLSGLSILEDEVLKILTKANKAVGVRTLANADIHSKAVILACGTFLNGLIHIGLKSFPAGRINEPASINLSKNLIKLGFKVKRFKTGTCARIKASSIDFSKLESQSPDIKPTAFSFNGNPSRLKQLPCFITYTNDKTHKIIRDSLNLSPLYTGKIKACGVRYCPSVEDKIVKFPLHRRHQIFLEPETQEPIEYYPNGLSTSLPEDVQLKIIQSINGLENAAFVRPGYGIEHDMIDPTQLKPTLETKLIENLFVTGQLNGTTGYEEAASLGLIGGINASLKLTKRAAFILDRSSSYIGVLIDDLVTKGTDEPYRMFTSRVEYRLLLREDNADLRLGKLGFSLGLVSKQDYETTLEKKRIIDSELSRLKKIKLKPDEKTNAILKIFKSSPIKRAISLEELLQRPEINYEQLNVFSEQVSLPDNLAQAINSQIKYAPFIKRQQEEIDKFRHLEKIKLSKDINFSDIPGLSREIKEKLEKFKPLTLASAWRICGVTPASISILMTWLEKDRKQAVSN
jgi:tRNA uridine 5-carboxymethylaminomethyl modification enzyme